MEELGIELSLIEAHSASAKGCRWYWRIRDLHPQHCEFILNFDERRRQGETISGVLESTINQVVSRCFVKRQQMQSTLRGAHLLLQTRTNALNNELANTFKHWYPGFRAHAVSL